MTIYTSKKNGKSYTLTNEEIHVNLNGDQKMVYTLTNTEDSSDVVTTTESVLKRWYKKSVVVDFTAAEPKPAEENLVPMPGANKLSSLADEYGKKPVEKPKARKTRKPSTRKPDEPVETIELTLAEAEAYFHGFVVDTDAGKVRSGVFHPRKITALAEGIIEFTRRHTIYRVSTAC